MAGAAFNFIAVVPAVGLGGRKQRWLRARLLTISSTVCIIFIIIIIIIVVI